MSKGKKNKTNPQKQPKTQKDVDEAFDKGLNLGLKCADLIWFNTILDKHPEVTDLDRLWDEVLKLQHEVAEGRVKWNDLAKTLKEEYLIKLNYI